VFALLSACQLREYRQLRQVKGYPARTALATVRSAETATRVPWSLDESFHYQGFDVVVTCQPDQDADFSYLGEFTDKATSRHSEGYYLVNPNSRNDRHVYGFFELANPVPEVAADLIKNCKYGKRAAWETAWKQAKDDMQHALDYTAYVVTVTASRHGIELGYDILSGVESESDSDIVEEVLCNSMIDNAISEAKANLARLCKV
jgi:hypothetical protein